MLRSFPALPAELRLPRTVPDECNTHGIDSGDIFAGSSVIAGSARGADHFLLPEAGAPLQPDP
jgi:hypothetical protein